ncbi:scarecrow-like protein 6 [Diospyros lotus]|uniref:scarecrow-like protein 6 n=1 Tax=Diospyros lotus TaxID=55363 RepID=UPI0022585817|nr:scarecrow-like protein 6 [Diospyros lotus]
MPLPFDFEGKGVLDFAVAEPSSSCSLSSVNPLLFQWKENWNKESCFLGREQPEPTSVLETIGSPSPPTSSSTLSSSFDGGGGGGGSTETAGVAAVSGNPSQKWQEPTTSSGPGLDSELHPVPPLLGAASAAAAPEKCGLGIDDWEGVLSESVAASPTQEQSILRWIMGDVDDPSMGLNKLLQTGAPPELEFPTAAFGVGDHGFGSDPVGSFFPSPNLMPPTMNPSIPTSGFPQNPIFSPLSSNLVPPLDVKPQIFSPQVLINQHQALNPQNSSCFLPYAQQENHLFSPPQPKRHNPGGLELNPPMLPHPFQLLPSYGKPKILDHELGQNQNQNHNQNHQQAIIDQIFKAAELVQTGNSALAQGILARLNHQLSPIGKPFHRAAFFCKEALQNSLNPVSATSLNSSSSSSSPFNLILKIGAYKSFSEVSPLIQFANFTCNQAMLEVLEGFNRIHVVDFDIGYGGQWASLMQELALRSCGAPSLKITAFASPSTHDQLELGLTRENLIHFAGEINMAFEFDILSLDSLSTASWSLPLRVSENEAVAVNLPVGSFSNYQLSLPMILGLVKQLAPKIVVSVDRGCDRMDLPFPAHVIHALQSYSNLLESIDAVNVNPDAMQKIERFLLQPGIEKIVMARCRSPEKSPHWRSLFLSSGFSPLALSNFAESQAECVVKRTPVRGFHVEKRQSSLVLCWQQKELISASAWRC